VAGTAICNTTESFTLVPGPNAAIGAAFCGELENILNQIARKEKRK
jgi:hypothetical protein